MKLLQSGSHIGKIKSGYLEQVIGEKEGKLMKKDKYTDGEIGNFEIIDDFLPPPAELVLKEKNVRVTINLRQSSVDFFKKVAKKHHSRYQKVIRSLVDSYASTYTNNV